MINLKTFAKTDPVMKKVWFTYESSGTVCREFATCAADKVDEAVASLSNLHTGFKLDKVVDLEKWEHPAENK